MNLFIKYNLAGILVFISGYIIYCFVFYLTEEFNVAIFLQTCLSVSMRYFLYKKWVFNSSEKIKLLYRYLLIIFFFLITNLVAMNILSSYFDNYYLLQLLIMVSLYSLSFRIFKKYLNIKK